MSEPEAVWLIRELLAVLKRDHHFSDAELHDLLCRVSDFLSEHTRARAAMAERRKFAVVKGGKE